MEKRSEWGEIDRMTNFHDPRVRPCGAVCSVPRSRDNSRRITARHAQNKLSNYCNCLIALVLKYKCTCDRFSHSRLNRKTMWKYPGLENGEEIVTGGWIIKINASFWPKHRSRIHLEITGPVPPTPSDTWSLVMVRTLSRHWERPRHRAGH